MTTTVGGFKTYGAAIDSLTPDVRQAADKAHKAAFGTPNYFRVLNLYVHRAFQQWCVDNKCLHCATELHSALKKHVERYPTSSRALDPLFTSLPDQFNVRGKWTAEEA